MKYKRKPGRIKDSWWKSFCRKNRVPVDGVFEGPLGSLCFEGRRLDGTPEAVSMQPVVSNLDLKDFL